MNKDPDAVLRLVHDRPTFTERPSKRRWQPLPIDRQTYIATLRWKAHWLGSVEGYLLPLPGEQLTLDTPANSLQYYAFEAEAIDQIAPANRLWGPIAIVGSPTDACPSGIQFVHPDDLQVPLPQRRVPGEASLRRRAIPRWTDPTNPTLALLKEHIKQQVLYHTAHMDMDLVPRDPSPEQLRHLQREYFTRQGAHESYLIHGEDTTELQPTTPLRDLQFVPNFTLLARFLDQQMLRVHIKLLVLREHPTATGLGVDHTPIPITIANLDTPAIRDIYSDESPYNEKTLRTALYQLGTDATRRQSLLGGFLINTVQKGRYFPTTAPLHEFVFCPRVPKVLDLVRTLGLTSHLWLIVVGRLGNEPRHWALYRTQLRYINRELAECESEELHPRHPPRPTDPQNRYSGQVTELTRQLGSEPRFTHVHLLLYDDSLFPTWNTPIKQLSAMESLEHIWNILYTQQIPSEVRVVSLVYDPLVPRGIVITQHHLGSNTQRRLHPLYIEAPAIERK